MKWKRSGVYYLASDPDGYTVSKSIVGSVAKYVAWRGGERLGGPYETPEQAQEMCEAYDEASGLTDLHEY